MGFKFVEQKNNTKVAYYSFRFERFLTIIWALVFVLVGIYFYVNFSAKQADPKVFFGFVVFFMMPWLAHVIWTFVEVWPVKIIVKRDQVVTIIEKRDTFLSKKVVKEIPNTDVKKIVAKKLKREKFDLRDMHKGDYYVMFLEYKTSLGAVVLEGLYPSFKKSNIFFDSNDKEVAWASYDIRINNGSNKYRIL